MRQKRRLDVGKRFVIKSYPLSPGRRQALNLEAQILIVEDRGGAGYQHRAVRAQIIEPTFSSAAQPVRALGVGLVQPLKGRTLLRRASDIRPATQPNSYLMDVVL